MNLFKNGSFRSRCFHFTQLISKNLQDLFSETKGIFDKRYKSTSRTASKIRVSEKHNSNSDIIVEKRSWGVKYGFDLLAVVFFALAALVFYSHRIGYDKVVTNLRGDAPMVAGVFAGRDYRSDFEGDPLLEQSRTTDAYITAAYWYVSIAHQWFNIPYGNAYISMLVPMVTLHLLGFYILGRVLFHSRIVAVLLAFSCSLLISFDTWGEFWGVFSSEPLNRVAIGSLLGILWSAAVYYGSKPKIRICIMAAIGFLLWIHPVAIPVLGFSIWLSFWVMRSETESLGKFVMNMALSAGVFLIVLLPYTLQYSTSFGHPNMPPTLYKKLYEIMANSFIDGYLKNELTAIKAFFYYFIFEKPFLSGAIIAMIVTFFIAEGKDRRTILQFGLMTLGIFLVSDVLFLIDHYVAAERQHIPLQVDLVRGNRFLVPLSLVIIFYSSTVIYRRYGLKLGAPIFFAVVFFIFGNLQPNIKEAFENMQHGYQVLTHEGKPSNLPDVEMLNWLHDETPRKTSVTAFFGDLLDNAVRYISLRQLKFAIKDSCFFNYFDWKKAIEYQDKKLLYTQVMQNTKLETRFQLAMKAALAFGSDLMVIDKLLFGESYRVVSNAILWENSKYAVIDLGEIDGFLLDSDRPHVKAMTTRSAYDREVQTCMYYVPPTRAAHPLIVYLHTWSGTAIDDSYINQMFELAQQHGYAMIAPNFRGKNSRREATGSELAITDILSAVSKLREMHSIDSGKIHLVGVSGGGYMALLMAGRIPELWKSVIAWCPIFDLALWYRECELSDKTFTYADHIRKSLHMDKRNSILGAYFARLAYLRSPARWLKHASGIPIYIYAGINDGHENASVPLSHSLNAFNMMAIEADRIPIEAVKKIVADRVIPKNLQSNSKESIFDNKTESDGKIGSRRKILLSKSSHNIHLIIFEGSHEMFPEENFKRVMVTFPVERTFNRRGSS